MWDGSLHFTLSTQSGGEHTRLKTYVFLFKCYLIFNVLTVQHEQITLLIAMDLAWSAWMALSEDEMLVDWCWGQAGLLVA